jgi:L-iditol 2-dehydrogenase
MCRGFKTSRLTPGGFAEYLVASAEHAEHAMHAVPPALGLEEATFMEPLACALKALPRLDLRPGDLVVLFGLGPMGLLFARLLARRPGARLVAVEPNAERRARAARDAVAAFAPGDPALAERIRAETGGRGADAAILLAGRGALVGEALSLVRDAGRVCVFAAAPGESAVPIPIDMVYYREIALFGSYSPDPTGFAEALALLSERAVRVDDLITHRLPLDETPDAFERAVRGEGMKFMIRPRGETT